MKIQRTIRYIILITITISINACYFTLAPDSQSDPFWDDKEQLMLLDFEDEAVISELKSFHATASSVSEGVTNGNKALRLDMKGDQQYVGMEYRPNTPIDATKFNNFSLVFDATNPTKDYSVQIFVNVENEKGQTVSRADVVPIGETRTHFFELAGKYVGEDTGLRDDPNPWGAQSSHMKIRGLKSNIDLDRKSVV